MFEKFMSYAAPIGMSIFILFGPHYAKAASTGQVCTVADPTGTPLNVRGTPGTTSKILGALSNGTKV